MGAAAWSGIKAAVTARSLLLTTYRNCNSPVRGRKTQMEAVAMVGCPDPDHALSEEGDHLRN